MNRVWAVLALTLAAATPTAAEELIGESLYVPAPPGWTVGFHDRQGDIELTELVPNGQTVRDWRDMISIEIQHGTPKKTAQEFLAEQIARVKAECVDAGAGPVSPGMENGYETAIRAVACTKSKRYGKGEINLYKSLRGRERMYLVARSWRGEPFDKAHLPVPPETTLEWLAYMNKVVVCDSRDPQRVCPKSQAGAAPLAPRQP